MARRKPRKGEYVCSCSAYKFPHKFGAGQCNGFWIVQETWEHNWGGGICQTCNACNRIDGLQCDVYVGSESVKEGECWQEFVNYNEIKVYN